MKKLLLCGLILGLVLTSCTTIPPGSVGVVVHNFGDNKGVSNVATTTGFTWYNPMSTSIFEYPTNVQTAKWTRDLNEGKPVNEEITFTNKDNMVISTDISISYSLVYDKVPAFYVKFRNDNIDDFTHGYLRNTVRDAFNETGGSFNIDQIMGDNTAFIAAARKRAQSELEAIGVHIDQFGIIGAARPPQGVTDAITAKLAATQLAIQKENEVRQSVAQAQKDIAEARGDSAAKVIRAYGEAKANQLTQQTITDNLIQWKMLDKWNGVLPIYGAIPQMFKSVK